MTTIAYRDGILAADSLCTVDDMVAGECRKITKFKKGKKQILAGGAGSKHAVENFLNWVDNGAPEEDLDKIHGDFNGFLAIKKGKKDPKIYICCRISLLFGMLMRMYSQRGLVEK